MPSGNRVIIAAAGSGKTTAIVTEATDNEAGRSALITYTNNSTSELRGKALELHGFVPPQISVATWYGFLLRHLVRPYQSRLHGSHVNSLQFVNGRSVPMVPEKNTERHYFSGLGRIYVDKVSKFACKLIAETGGAPIARIEQIFDRLYIDEAQDLAGYDLDLVEMLFATRINIVLVGDLRQATYRTNNAGKNSAYVGPKIINKFRAWEQAGQVDIEPHNYSFRCVQAICDFADALYPDFEQTISRNETVTGHDGVFAVRRRDLAAYFERYRPQTLRYNRTTKAAIGVPYNYGEAKGMTFERTLIYPHGPLEKYLKTGKLADAGKELAKIYVAVTRARQSVAFVVPDTSRGLIVPIINL